MRQAGQHGGLRQAQVFERLAKVHPRGTAETIGPLPQVDLVHVQLQNLVLGERALHLVRQHHLGELARKQLFFGEVEVARHLHGDGGRPLLEATGHVGQQRAGYTLVVHTAVLVKTRVFNGQQRLLLHQRNVFDGHKLAPLLAKFTNQHAVAGVDAQGDFGPVVDHGVQVGQVQRRGGLRRCRSDTRQQ